MGCSSSKPAKAQANQPTKADNTKDAGKDNLPQQNPTANAGSETGALHGANPSSNQLPGQPSRKASLSKMIIQSSINLANKMNNGMFTALTSMEEIRRRYRFEPKIYGNLLILVIAHSSPWYRVRQVRKCQSSQAYS